MLYAGLGLPRKRVDVCLLNERGERVAVTSAPSDADGLRSLSARFAGAGGKTPPAPAAARLC